jgi:hypothetical protein
VPTQGKRGTPQHPAAAAAAAADHMHRGLRGVPLNPAKHACAPRPGFQVPQCGMHLLQHLNAASSIQTQTHTTQTPTHATHTKTHAVLPP